MNSQLNTQLNSKAKLEKFITENLDIVPETHHLDELWVVVSRTLGRGINVTKENIIDYYLTCLRYDNLKD